MVTRSLSAEGTQGRRHGQAFFTPDQLLRDIAADARTAIADAVADGGQGEGQVIPLHPHNNNDSNDDNDSNDEGSGAAGGGSWEVSQ